MKKITFYFIVFGYITSLVTCLKVVEIIDDVLPTPVSRFLEGLKEDTVNAWKDGAEAVKKMISDKVVPISQLPLYYYRAENKVYTLTELKRHGKKFMRGSVMPGTHLQNLAQVYGFYDMIDVKHVVCEFFYNAAEIVFYRGRDNFSEDILEEVEKLGVLKPEDIKPLVELGFDKKGQALSTWYWVEEYEEFVPLMGELLGKEGEGKGYRILSKEKVAIKEKYMKLTNDIATLVWHLFYAYEEEYSPRENIVHRQLKREQIEGHLMGNIFVFSMFNDTVSFHKVRDIYLGEKKLKTGPLKKQIKKFIIGIGEIYTEGTVKPFEEKTLIQKLVQYILRKVGLVEYKGDLFELYRFKMEVLVTLSKMLERSDLNEEKAKQIIELSMNNWRTVFYLQVSGTMTSTKPAPDFYHHHETVEDLNSHETSDSDTVERDRSQPKNVEIIKAKTPDNSADGDVSQFDDSAIADLSELGAKPLTEKDNIAKILEDKNPFMDLLKRSLSMVDLDMKKIREELIYTFQIICEYYLFLSEDDCAFIKHAIKNINTYVLKKDKKDKNDKKDKKYEKDTKDEKDRVEKIASRKYCTEHDEMTEIQGVSMAIVEYLILLCEKKESLEGESDKRKRRLRKDLKIMFKKYYFLRIFVTKEYRKALTDYARGIKDSNIAKLAIERVKQIKNGVQLMTKKPPKMDIRDMDNILITDNSNKRKRKEAKTGLDSSKKQKF